MTLSSISQLEAQPRPKQPLPREAARDSRKLISGEAKLTLPARMRMILRKKRRDHLKGKNRKVQGEK
jgi:hypothetical protein